MERIIADSYTKDQKAIFGDNPETDFNKKILAVNRMYGWLYEQGILRDISFKFKDYSDMSYFVLDVKDLEPYREQMEKSCTEGSALAVQHIFDEEYTPCLYSGAIQLGWTMLTYRDFSGTVSKSWETGMIQGLNNTTILDILVTKNEKGVKEAVSQTFDACDFEPDLFDKACEYFQDYVDIEDKDNLEFFNRHADRLIYCYEHKRDILDFDFWVQYENLLGEKITWDEYIAIDNNFDGDPHDVKETDINIISEFRNSLNECRAPVTVTQEEMDAMCISAENRLKKEANKEFQSLADKIQIASERTHKTESHGQGNTHNER